MPQNGHFSASVALGWPSSAKFEKARRNGVIRINTEGSATLIR
jgi:hypothetical protein